MRVRPCIGMCAGTQEVAAFAIRSGGDRGGRNGVRGTKGGCPYAHLLEMRVCRKSGFCRLSAPDPVDKTPQSCYGRFP